MSRSRSSWAIRASRRGRQPRLRRVQSAFVGVRLLGSVFHGYVSLEEAGGFDHSRAARDVDASWHRTLDAVDALLRNWPPA